MWKSILIRLTNLLLVLTFFIQIIFVLIKEPYAKFRNSFKYTNLEIKNIDEMENSIFVKYLLIILKSQNYKIKNIEYVGIYDANLIIVKNKIKTIVCVKKCKENIDIDVIQKAIVSKKHKNCNNILIVTNGYYTDSAKLLAEENNIVLWDRIKLTDNLMLVKI